MCTSNRSKYVKYLSHCPQCNRYGGLYALFTKNSPEGKEYGPYFYVMHHTMEWDKENKSEKVKKSWKCYVGINSEFVKILEFKTEVAV